MSDETNEIAIESELRRLHYLPIGGALGAIYGAVAGGNVCQPWTAYGGLFGVVLGAAASSWKRSRQERLFKHLDDMNDESARKPIGSRSHAHAEAVNDVVETCGRDRVPAHCHIAARPE
jgi:hypothetical protein